MNTTVKQNKPKVAKADRPRGEGLFGRIDRLFRIDTSFDSGLPVKFVPYVLYFTCLGLFYIGNNHYAEKNIRKINRLEEEVEDLRANYTTLKADYMYASKQSEVARRVKKMGLQESETPPFKIKVEE
ncbi:MAG: FtsL-like putative cell division protein [Cyclobacteriaceae bacterium]